jgi:outer membrane receptor for ferrienterochelin and colicin
MLYHQRVSSRKLALCFGVIALACATCPHARAQGSAQSRGLSGLVIVTLADENLRAERLTRGEAGLFYSHDNRLAVRAEAFRTDVTRPVANVTLSVTPALIAVGRTSGARLSSRSALPSSCAWG